MLKKIGKIMCTPFHLIYQGAVKVNEYVNSDSVAVALAFLFIVSLTIMAHPIRNGYGIGDVIVVGVLCGIGATAILTFCPVLLSTIIYGTLTLSSPFERLYDYCNRKTLDYFIQQDKRYPITRAVIVNSTNS